jgi:ABC-type Fe3+-hydroxamate transport system substrate-binding protein
MRTVIAAAAALVLLAGCSSNKTVTTANGTTVTTDTSNQSVTVKSDQGTATYGKNAVNPASLGLPVYPGAVNSDNAGYAASTKEGSGQVVILTTTDTFDQVYGWYHTHMPAGSEKMKMTAGGGSIAQFQIGGPTDKIQKVIEITGNGAKTSIMLTSGTKP